MIINSAVFEDYKTINDLVKEGQNEHADALPYIFKKVDNVMPESYFKELLEDPDSEILVARENETVVGFAVMELNESPPKEGSWRFDVPISQLPYETVNVDKGTSEEDAEINIHFDSIIEGKASTAINYTAAFPLEGRHDQVQLEVYDDQGKEINISTDGIDLETVKENNRIIVKGRSIIPQSIKGETGYIEVLPKVALSEPDHFIRLDEATPVEVNAGRQDLAVEIENITFQDKSITFDFQINNGNNMNRHFSFFSNFARNDVTLVKESEKDIYEKPIKHSVDVINKDTLRFTSKFDISKIDDFSLKDYVIRVNMGSLSANIPVELEKVKIDLN